MRAALTGDLNNAADSPLNASQKPPAEITRLLQGAILPTLLRLAAPNVVALTLQVLVSIAETIYIGRLGSTPLAAMALVFPFVMLAQQLSAGAMGGGRVASPGSVASVEMEPPLTASPAPAQEMPSHWNIPCSPYADVTARSTLSKTARLTT